jgi:cellobiose epimerase
MPHILTKSDINEKSKMLSHLKVFAQNELVNNILSYWTRYTIDNTYGGFYGRIDENNAIDDKADKGLILNARILWTFSAASLFYENREYKALADRAYQYIMKYFYDSESKGFYWKINYKGEPVETKKQIYAQAFVIYALSEYYKLTHEQNILDFAAETFEMIEKYSFDKNKKGYFEAFDRQWRTMDDLRLSAKDMNEKKTMNTHLHVLEAFSNLYKVYRNENLKNSIINLLEVYDKYIIDQSFHHYNLFFDEDWKVKSNQISFGHDIEGSWLMLEAAEVIEDPALIKKFQKIAINMADSCIMGITEKGALSQDAERGKINLSNETEWWVVAEAVVGFLNAYFLTTNIEFLKIAYNNALFIQDYIIDKNFGEWCSLADIQGNIIKGHDKIGFWKCPYHNSRMCLEILSRIHKHSFM